MPLPLAAVACSCGLSVTLRLSRLGSLPPQRLPRKPLRSALSKRRRAWCNASPPTRYMHVLLLLRWPLQLVIGLKSRAVGAANQVYVCGGHGCVASTPPHHRRSVLPTLTRATYSAWNRSCSERGRHWSKSRWRARKATQSWWSSGMRCDWLYFTAII